MSSKADAIFVLSSLIYGVGMVLLLSSKLNSGAIRKSGGLSKSLAVMCALGAAVGLVGGVNLVLVHRSSRSSATGQIVNLYEYHGKHNHSSFYVPRENGSLLRVNCDYTGNHLVPGETVHVDVLNYQSTLINLAVLDGQYAGWTRTEGDGTFGSEVAISGGFAAALTAWVRRRRIGRPETVLNEG